MDRSDLRVGTIRDTLASGAPRKTGPIWTVNRDDSQWRAIEDKRIFAMSSSCDKKEYFPPTKMVDDAFTTQLFQLAEIHNQLNEEDNKMHLSRFEMFVKQLKTPSIAYVDFRQSDAFDSFLSNEPSTSKRQKMQTPTKDEFDDAYSESELQSLKMSRYDY